MTNVDVLRQQIRNYYGDPLSTGEIASNRDFDPAENGELVEEQDFPAVPGLVEMVRFAQERGHADPTRLSDGEDGLLTKPAVADYPDYLKQACASSPGGRCTTVQYKTATRAHIEEQGYDVVASVGDQDSDLDGGFSDRTFKLPNPSYYLP